MGFASGERKISVKPRGISIADVSDIMASATGTETTRPRSYVRVLQWTFSRDAETVRCELGLTEDESAYELRVDPPWNPTGVSTEFFDDAMSAFQRHAALERALISDGWTLESFESHKIERPKLSS